MNNKNKIIPLDEVVYKFNKHNKDFIKELDKQEIIDNSISCNDLDIRMKNELKALNYSNEVKKKQFINDIKNGLGYKVKENKNKVTINKNEVKLMTKIINFIKKIFVKF